MISTIAYPEKNALHIRFKDNVTTTQFDTFHRELANLLKPLAKGFVLISDFTELTEMDFACWKPIGYMMDAKQLKAFRKFFNDLSSVRLRKKRPIGSRSPNRAKRSTSFGI